MMKNHINYATHHTVTAPPPGCCQLFMLLFVLLLSTSAPASTAAPPIAVQGCLDRCGNVSIPYPFGIGPDPKCFLNNWYSVNCSDSTPYFASLVWKVSDDSQPLVMDSIGTEPITLPSSPNTPLLTLSVLGANFGLRENDTGKLSPLLKIDMRESPFNLMPLVNTLLVIGCNGTAAVADLHNKVVVGCTSVCTNTREQNATDTHLVPYIQGSSCYGIGCCQAPIPKSLDYFQWEYRATLGATIESGLWSVLANTSYLADISTTADTWSWAISAPTAIQWKVLDLPHKSATTVCTYYNDTDLGGGGYICRCKHEYYQGNPYLPSGCQVLKECEKCRHNCQRVSLVNKTYGCPIIPADYPINNKLTLRLSLGLGISLGSVAIAVTAYGLFLLIKKRKEIRRRHINFIKNGGLLLDQQMSTREGSIGRTKVFTSEELKKATDNFNENRVLGRGGQGTVYKGMLPDGTIVAVKKSKNVNSSQLGQFINEVVILSQINHRNVVKLFGCCLETEVPLLVYEFVLNDTLFRHIHDPKEDFRMTWRMRLQIAVESAEALRYLHSSSSTPIYHRDIKTSNILLDDRYRAKIADFGISRTVSNDQSHVTTNVQGTFGYIDPQYFQSHQYTEKSDVYSFGVVLVELLTSKKPVYVDKDCDPKSLASEFLLCMHQSRLYDIVDVDVVQETQMEVVEGVANLAKRCLSLNGYLRPTMHEVSMTLQTILSQTGAPYSLSKNMVNLRKKDQLDSVDDGPIISSPPSSSDDSFIDLQWLFGTNMH